MSYVPIYFNIFTVRLLSVSDRTVGIFNIYILQYLQFYTVVSLFFTVLKIRVIEMLVFIKSDTNETR